MTHEDYLLAKAELRKYAEIVNEYERQIHYRESKRKTEMIKEKFSKGTLVTFTGGSHTKKLQRGSQYPMVSFKKEGYYIHWMMTVKTEKGEYVQLPEYCFLEIRELNTQLKREFNESTNN
jgi:hypothetical protein